MRPININDPTPKSKSNFYQVNQTAPNSSQKYGNFIGKQTPDQSSKNLMHHQQM
jgi:hypothetical protein